MGITFNKLDEHIVITLDGYHTLYNIIELKDAIKSQVDNRTTSLIIDLKHVHSIDSSVIGILYMAMRKIEALNGHFYLSNVPFEIDRIISESGLFFPRFKYEERQ